GEVIAAESSRFYHDCSTLGGNSGSPVVSLKTCELVGVHRSGDFMYRNESVPATSLGPFVQAPGWARARRRREIMAVRALLMPVEKYSDASGLANELPGTNDAAKRFCDWLAERKGVYPKGHPKFDPKAFFGCAAPEVGFGTHGTTRPEIIQAVVD